MKRVKKLCKRLLLGTSLILCLNTASIPISYLINRNIRSEKNTIVFTSGKSNLKDYGISEIPSSLMSGITNFFMYTPIILGQNLKGNKVYWCSNPSLEKFAEEICNPYYDNIIIIGHGSKDSFALFDGDIHACDLRSMPLPYRNGEFYQYTCGQGDNSETLRDVLFSNCKRSKTFEGILDPFTSYVSAWKDVSSFDE